MNREYFQKLYEEEWARRDQLANGLSMPLTLMSIVGGAIAFCFQSFDSANLLLQIAFYLGLVLTLAALVRAAYLFAQSYHGYTYRQIPKAQQIVEYRDAMRQAYMDAERPKADAEVRAENVLTERYVEAIDRNRDINNARSDLIYQGNAALLAAVVAPAFTIVPTAINLRIKDPQTCRVEVIREGVTRVSSDQQETKPAQPVNQVQPPKLVEPTLAPNVDVRTEVRIDTSKTIVEKKTGHE